MNESKERTTNSLRISELLLSSCAGAVITSLFVTPFDVVKTRLQVQVKDIANVKALCPPYNCLWDDLCNNGKCCVMHSKSHFGGTFDAFAKIAKYEGITTLWSGLTPTLVMSVPATVVYFTMYDKFKEKISKNQLIPLGSFGVSLLSGVSARVVTVTLVCPIEFIRTRLQSEKVKYSTLFQSVRELIKHRGIISLWHGWVPTLLRDAPFSAIYWSVYEQLKLLQGQPSLWKTLLFGAASGSIAATVTLPFDVIKTHRQSELGGAELLKHTNKVSMQVLLKDVFKKGGSKAVFAGLVPRLLKVAPACAIMITSYEVGKSYFMNKNIEQTKIIK